MADLKIDTNKMNDYAERIDAANQRIAALDRQLNSLYYSFGLLDVFRIIQADMLLSYGSALQQCSSYLRETAASFEEIERTLAAQDPLNFDASALLKAVAFNPQITDWIHIGLTLQEMFDNSVIMLGCATLSPLPAIIIQNFVTGKFEHEGHFHFDLFDEDGHLTSKNIDIWGKFSNKDALWSYEAEKDYFWNHENYNFGLDTGGVWGEGRFQFYNSKTGELQPGAAGNFEAEEAILHFDGESRTGNKRWGQSRSIDLNGGYAYGGGDFRAGYLGEDAYGEAVYGITGKGGAIASAFHGGTKYTITLGGVDITFGMGYDSLGVGGDFDYGITTRGVNFSGELAFVEGFSFSFSVDWTDNRDFCNFIDDSLDYWNKRADMYQDAYQNVFDTARDLWNGGVDTICNRWNTGMENLQEAGSEFVDWVDSWF